jgi:hypothetical protein
METTHDPLRLSALWAIPCFIGVVAGNWFARIVGSLFINHHVFLPLLEQKIGFE